MSTANLDNHLENRVKGIQPQAGTREKKIPDLFLLLPILVLCADLFSPFLIWKHILPAQMRWASHLTIAVMIILVILQILVIKRVPVFAWLGLIVLLIWGYIAIGRGQGMPATLWGGWLLFQFPVVALFAYLQPRPSPHLPDTLQRYGLLLLILEVILQVFQYIFGEPPGDDLAGLFGNNGTGIAVIFAIMVNSLFLGYWITTKRWKVLLITLLLGTISSVLGEMKLYPFALTVIGLLAILIYAIEHRSARVLVTLPLVIGILIGFTYLYNTLVPGAKKVPLQTYLEDPVKLFQYMNRAQSYYTTTGTLVTDIGRGYALKVGWDSISREPVTLLFGYGLGARSESRTLGTAGIGLTSGNLGLSVGTSLLIMMQEIGLLGLLILGLVMLLIIFEMLHGIRNAPFSTVNGLRYALLFCTILWPLWFWYANVWVMRVPMFLYWYLLGYVLADSHRTVHKHLLEDR